MSQHGRAWGSYSVEYVRKVGREDGRPWAWRLWPFTKEKKDSYPGSKIPYPAPFWTTLQEDANTAVGVLGSEWKTESKTLYDTWRKADTEYERAKIEVGKELQDAHIADSASGDASTELQKMGRPALDRRIALLILIGLGAGEACFNAVIFQLLGEGVLATVVLALAVSISFPWLGHFIGVHLKQTTRRPTDWLLMVVALAAAIGGLLAVAYFRGWFIEAGEMREVLGLQIPTEAARNLFFVINLVLLVASIAAAYMSAHPKAEEFEAKHGNYRDLKKRADKEGAEGAAANQQLMDAELAVNEAAEALKSLYGVYRSQAIAIINTNKMFASEYMNANLRARGDGSPAPCFYHPGTKKADIPTAALPAVFKDEELTLKSASVFNQYKRSSQLADEDENPGINGAAADGENQ